MASGPAPDSNRVPRSQQIAGVLRERIRTSHEPGDRLSSEVKFAEEFGVSTLTIREALAFLVQEGRVVRRRGSGTYVAETAQAEFVAILTQLDTIHQNTSYFFQLLTQQVCDQARAQGLPYRLYHGYGNTDVTPLDSFGEAGSNLVGAINDGDVRGIIALNADARGRWHAVAKDRGLPLVGHGRVYDHSVRISNADLAQQGVEYLHNCGRRRLALIGWGGPIVSAPFREALDTFGLAARDAWIRVDRHPCGPGAGYHSLQEIWAAAGRKPDGLVVTDEVLFDSAVPAILELGISVPDDLMVIRHANRGMGGFAPFPVARLEIDPAAIASGMLGLYRELADHGTAQPPHRLVLPKLVVEQADTADASP